MVTHLNDSVAFRDKVLSQDRGDVISQPGMIVAQCHPIDDTRRVAGNTYPHIGIVSKDAAKSAAYQSLVS